MSVEISTIVAGAERLGEGAVWDTEDQRLWWVDITGGLIHCYNPEDMSNQSFACLLYTSPSPRDQLTSRMPSSA